MNWGQAAAGSAATTCPGNESRLLLTACLTGPWPQDFLGKPPACEEVKKIKYFNGLKGASS